MISRMQQADPSIEPGKPISIKKVTESFEKMRSQGGGRPSSNDDGLTAELLVPDFTVESEPAPLMGFGPAAELMAVEVTDDDRKQASDMMGRMDRDRDGVLSKRELERFAGNPMDFDRNRDGKLSLNELAIRYARRREVSEDSRKDRRGDRRDRRSSESNEPPPDIYGGRKSYRIVSGSQSVEGLPGYFTDKDANNDRQVEMAEFATKWTPELVAEFSGYDINGDGTITVQEALQEVNNRGSATSGDSSTASTSSSSGSSSSSSAGPLDDKYKKYAERLISRFDKNKDGELTATEWKTMLMSPAAADTNRDGRITLEEYGLWMQSRSKKN